MNELRRSAPLVYWTPLGAIAWIATRNIDRVGEIEFNLDQWQEWLGQPAKEVWPRQLSLAVLEDCSCDRPPCTCVDRATSELIEQLQTGALTAFGANADTGETEFPLPEAFAFARLSFRSVDGLNLLRKVRHLRVRRNEVVALWPARASNQGPDKREKEPQVMATSAAVTECEKWLERQFADPANAGVCRTEFRERAMAEISPGRLSGRGFKTAWRAATEKYPSFRQPGPRSK